MPSRPHLHLAKNAMLGEVPQSCILAQTPTAEQEAIIAAVRATTSNLMVSAYAGCAKTTSLCMLAEAWSAQHLSSKGCALAFNVRIKEELAERLPKNFECVTLNALGHKVWAKHLGKYSKLDSNKISRLTEVVCQAEGVRDLWRDVKSLATAAMHAGLVPTNWSVPGIIPDTPESWEVLAEDEDRNVAAWPYARRVLINSIKESLSGTISFDDQIYMSALFTRPDAWPTFDFLLVDEAQDLSPLNHRQVAHIKAKRLAVVGDPKQAIYSFRGADSASMEKMRLLADDWIDLPLTLTFRCPQAIVARQQEHAPGFRTGEGAPQGQITRWEDSWGPQTIPTTETAILCRNNAPLVALAFALLRGKRGFTMLGRDIGANLSGLSKRILNQRSAQRADMLDSIARWASRERASAAAQKKWRRIDGINDREACLTAVAEGCDSPAQVVTALEQMFAPNTSTKLTLATGHRSKGLEWETVIFLDSYRIPSDFAVRSGDPVALSQEANLRYVIETRTKSTLIFADFTDFNPKH